MAKSLNISIPDTLISNELAEITKFVRSKSRTIVKPLSNGYPHSIETRECTADDFSDDAVVGLAPHIYQELVEAVSDIRVFIVGNSVFAGELKRDEINTKIDWRMLASGWQAHQLSADCANSLLQLTHQMGLRTASHDLRLTAEGEYIYLETNPSGQFLFLEIDCDLPLSEAMAQYLIS
jgi:glutathione synthase/RimK-type ligase-like ATP-grasp enzyme